MKKFTVLLAIIALACTLFISCEDETSKPTPADNSEWLRIGEQLLPGIYDINVVDENEIWIVGMDGFVAKTSNQGVDWDTLSFPEIWQSFFDIDFVGSSDIWICGQKGALLRSQNGGDDWEQVYIDNFYHYDSTFLDSATLESYQIIDTNNINFTVDRDTYKIIDTAYIEFEDIDMYDIEFVNQNNGFIVCSRGIVYTTSDGGETWSGKYALDTLITEFYRYSITLQTLVFYDTISTDTLEIDTIFFDVEYTDTNFYEIYTINNSNLYGSCHSGTDNCWAVGFELLLIYSDDMGNTWKMQHAQDDTIDLYDVNFINDLQGWAIGQSGRILKTVDGGENWTRVTGHDCRQNLNELTFAPGNITGWLVGDDQAILRTVDGGETWTREYSDLNADFNSIGILPTDIQTRWVVGYRPNAHVGTILYTPNDGGDWDIQSYGINRTLGGLYFVDELNGWVVGSDGVCCNTTDGGETWVHQNSRTSSFINSIYFTDLNNGCLVGNDGVLRTTSDGGINWETITSGTDVRLYKVAFPSAMVGYACGEEGIIIKTSDGGDNWEIIEIPEDIEDVYLKDLCFASEDEGWVCGDNGTIIHTVDGGVTWEIQESNTITNLSGIHFINTDEGWVCGGIDGGVSRVHHTADGGETWVYQSTGESIWWTDVFFIDANDGWVVGLNGKIYHTSDGGETWLRQLGEGEGNLAEVFFVNSDINFGWAVGINGVVLKYHPEE